MNMKLYISKNKTISDVQKDFSNQYPFLKLEFYKRQKADPTLPVKKQLSQSVLLNAAGLEKNGVIEVEDEMTVGELEKTFLLQFGLSAQVSRKSGIIWLETTMTDNWTLKKQNEYGKEITLSTKSILPDEPIGENM